HPWDKDAVCACLEISPGAPDCFLQACCFVSDLKQIRICTSIDDKRETRSPGLFACCSNPLNLLLHCIKRLENSRVVFQIHSGCPGFDHLSDCLRHIFDSWTVSSFNISRHRNL